MRPGQDLEQQALVHLSDDDARAAVAAFHQCGGGVETQPAFRFRGVVALHACGREERLDVAQVVHRGGGAGCGHEQGKGRGEAFHRDS